MEMGRRLKKEGAKWKSSKYRMRIFRLYRSFQRSPFYLPLLLFIPSYLVLAIAVFLLEQHSPNNAFTTLLDSFWWAIVTASTLGYGDIVPYTIGGRIFAALITLIGLAVTSLFSAALASLFVQRSSRRRNGLMSFPKLKKHLVICGWKPQIVSLLKDVLEYSNDFIDEDIVLVSNITGRFLNRLLEKKGSRG